MNKLFFRQFRLMASIGVLPQERQRRQVIVIDLEFAVDIARAALSDKVSDTIDYVGVKRCIQHVVDARHYDLLETLADTLLRTLVDRFALRGLRLSISKPDIFDDMEAVGVVVECFE